MRGEKVVPDPKAPRIEIQEIDCALCGGWVECYDYIDQGDPAALLTTYCTKHEAEDLDKKGRSKKVRRHLRTLGLEVEP